MNIVSAYELRLSEDNKGVVQVRHLNVWGSICSDGFDNKDAKVVCRELGYQDGFSYYEHDFTRRRLSLPWLSNLNCTGNEGYIARCGNIRWGNVGNCSQDTKAAVYCLENASEYQKCKHTYYMEYIFFSYTFLKACFF